MEEERTGQKILMEKSEGKPQLTTFRRKLENNIKIDFWGKQRWARTVHTWLRLREGGWLLCKLRWTNKCHKNGGILNSARFIRFSTMT
jgi:hypothetical protein